jgi:fumarate reductase subunit D
VDFWSRLGDIVESQQERMPVSQEDLYKAEEKLVLDRLEKSIGYYRNRVKYARAGHYMVGLTTLICSVLAPMAVITTAGKPSDLSVFGISNEIIARLAVVLTLILGLTEGIRRLFKYSERWMTCFRSQAKLGELLQLYRLSQIPLAVGAEAWIKNLDDLQKNIRAVETEEEGGFFDRLKVTTKDD